MTQVVRPAGDAPSAPAGQSLARRLVRQYPLVVVTVAVLVVTLLLGAAGQPLAGRWLASVWALLVAARVFRGMIQDLRAGTWGIDVLAVSAIVATVVVGEYVAALVVVLMLTGGQGLEDYAAHRARGELRALLERAPVAAHRLEPDDSVVDVPVGDVVAGDRLLIRPAEVVPVDGTLISDEAELDESSLTGESLPVPHRAGDAVLSGVLNTERAVLVRASASAEESQYARIVAMVSEATQSQAPVVRLADRYAVPFTVLAFAIAAAAWWWHGDATVVAQVLVVATPCPLLIAAPVAFLAGMSRSAHAGVIIKDAGTLEQLARVRTVAFDKTGTLTYGRPELVAVHAVHRGTRTTSCASPPRPSSTPRTCWRPPCGTPPRRGTCCSHARPTPSRRRPTGSPLTWTGTWSSWASERTSPPPRGAWGTSRSHRASWRCTSRSTARAPARWC
jgi:cation transport ATPase